MLGAINPGGYSIGAGFTQAVQFNIFTMKPGPDLGGKIEIHFVIAAHES